MRVAALVVVSLTLVAGSAFKNSAPSILPSMPVGDKGSGVEHCHGARAAVHPYRLITWELQDRRHGRHADRTPIVRGKSCRHARLAMREWRGRAAAARDSWRRWVEDEWNTDAWLPSKFWRVAVCETGYNGAPRWDWDSGTYVSAFGIIRGGYATFARRLGLPTWDDPGVRTPREQFLVAAALQRTYGWGAWGCGGS